MDALFGALGRRGAWAIVTQLRQGNETNLRALASIANVPVSSALRVVQDLEKLGVVDKLRPGRDARIQWRDGPVSQWLHDLSPPSIEDEVESTFAAAYAGPGRVVRWQPQGAPLLPIHLAIITGDDDAWDMFDDALDAVARAGWPAPNVSVVNPDDLTPDDPLYPNR